MRIAAIARDGVDRLDLLRSELEEQLHGPRHDLVLTHTRPKHTVELDDAMRGRIAGALRHAVPPRHVPDTIVALPMVPHTLTGKKLELPVKLILTGVPAAEVVSRDALASPASMEPVLAYAKSRPLPA